MDAKPAAEKVVADLAEQLHIPRKRHFTFYIVLVVAVIPLWSIVPLSWLFVLYALRSGKIWTFAWRGRALFIAALCEVFFSVHHYILAKYVVNPSTLPQGNTMELQAAFKRILQAGLASLPEEGFDEESLDEDRPGSPAEAITPLAYDDPRAIDFRNQLRTWFHKVPWSSIRRQEFYAWLYWSIFNTHLKSIEELPPSHQKVLQEVLQMVEARTGTTIPGGSDPAIQPLRLTLDPVIVALRPFVWYVAVAVSNWVVRRGLRKNWGAKIGTFNNLEYVIRVPANWNPYTGPRPIVFMHGLGLGLTQYQRFIVNLLRAAPDHPILVPLQPHVSQQIFHPRFLQPISRHELARSLAGLLDELGWVEWDERVLKESLPTGEKVKIRADTKLPIPTGVTMLSHSNGSFAHAWMLKAYPSMITRSCFVDPVTFCSWEGDLCYNFIYRPCATGLELIIKYFVGSELGTVNFLQRHFDWCSNSLWYEEIPSARDPSKTMFFLGGKDNIISAERVKRYLTSHGVRKGLWYDPHGRHGQAMFPNSPGYKEIMRWLQEAK
ncbi:hypothetical protein B0H21DRAFT_874266 [Amylocystis lapponica]|nr:hypothetical protein B0H21DRAFT_874266 [Amylocystis lapponica]